MVVRHLTAALVFSLGVTVFAGVATAGCSSAPTAGNDTLFCDAATPPDPQAAPVDLQSGNDTVDVSSGTLGGGITGTTGTKTITLSGGTIGSYADSGGITHFTMGAGSTATVTGSVTLGDNADTVAIGGGTIKGTVQQGAGIDDFVMTGGSIQSLQQGDGRDTFSMSGGTIVGAFEDGDIATFTGGTIGRVDMKLDNNVFIMSGGAILGNLVTGFGNDTITLSGGSIGGNISVSGGTDSVTVTGGTVRGNVLMSTGADNFTWDGGGVIRGMIDMGPDNDTATLRNLTSAQTAELKGMTGGAGNDALTLGGTAVDSVINASLITSFEQLAKVEAGTWAMSGTLTDFQSATVQAGTLILTGDNRAYAGQMTVQPQGTLQGSAASLTPTIANGGLVIFDQPANDTYAGVISGAGEVEKVGAGATILTADQTYTGQTRVNEGTLAVGDATHAAALAGGGGVAVAAGATLGGYGSVTGNVVNNGTVAVADATPGLGGGGQGDFTIHGTLTNAGNVEIGGAGVGNDLVVDNYVGANGRIALNAALGSDGSPSDRLIIDGGTATGTTGLAVTNVGGSGAITTGDGILVVDAINGATTAAGAFQLDGRAAGGAYEYALYRGGFDGGTPDDYYLRNTVVVPAPVPTDPDATAQVPVIRPEVPLYSPIPAISRQLGLAMLGTFHERQGDQSILQGAGLMTAGWGRLFGSHLEQSWSGTVHPSFDGNLWGLQAGFDLWGRDTPDGHQDRVGLFFGYSRADGDVRGAALMANNLAVGSLKLDGYSLGAYWTHVGPSGWYVDTVLMNTFLDAKADSNFNADLSPDGDLVTTSLEGGYPIGLGGGVSLEPQAQIIWQHLSLGTTQDAFSTVDFGDSDSFTGRIGARLQGKFEAGGTQWQPYLKANLWENFSHNDILAFAASAPITVEYGSTALELGAGSVARISDGLSLYGDAGYSFNLGGEHAQGLSANAGLRMTW